MRFMVYTLGGNLLGRIDDAQSFTWTRRYQQPGAFTATLPLTQENIRLTGIGNIVWFRGAQEYCVIETRTITDSPEQQTVELTGRDTLCLLDRRSLLRSYGADSSSLVRAALREMMASDYMVAIDGLIYENNSEVTGRFSEDVCFSQGQSLLDAAHECASYGDCGLQAVTDFASGGGTDARVRLYKGLDRSTAQSDRRPVVFSPRYGNLGRVMYTHSEPNHINTVIIHGYWTSIVRDEDSGETYSTTRRYREIVYENDTAPAPADRRESHIECSSASDSDEMTLSRFRAKMRTEARAQLGISRAVDSIEVEILGTSQFVYQKDYDVGDIVTVEIPQLGLEMDKRVIEVQEVFEQNVTRIVPTLGEPLPTRMRFRRRR